MHHISCVVFFYFQTAFNTVEYFLESPSNDVLQFFRIEKNNGVGQIILLRDLKTDPSLRTSYIVGLLINVLPM